MSLNRITQPEAQRLQAEAMTEKQFQTAVMKACGQTGWMAYHVLHPKGSEYGFPDLTAANANTGRLLFAELKTQPVLNPRTGRLTRKPSITVAQWQWLDSLSGPDMYPIDRISVYLWLPIDMIRGVIQDILMGEPVNTDTTWAARRTGLKALGIRQKWPE